MDRLTKLFESTILEDLRKTQAGSTMIPDRVYEIKKNNHKTCGTVCEETGECVSCAIHEAINKLGEYEDAEEEGTLFRLPCKIGDPVYIVRRSDNGKEITLDFVRTIEFLKDDIYIFTKSDLLFWGNFGKKFFFSIRDAERALFEQEDFT